MSGVSVTGGATDVTRYFVLRLASTGVEATGLTITNFDLQYVRAGAAPSAKVDATALAATDSAHGDNQAIEVDATDQPGLYRVDWPDAAFAAGVPFVILTVKCATCFTEHLCVPIDPPVNVTTIQGDVQSATDLKDFADAGYDPATNKVEGVKLADTVTTYTGNTPQTGDSFARLGAPAGASIAADIAAVEAQTDDIGTAGAGLTAVPWNAAWDAEVQSEVADALAVYDPPTKAELDSAVAPLALEATAQDILTDTGTTIPSTLSTIAGFIDTEVAAILAAVDTEVAAILADTNELQTDWVNGGRLDLLIDAIKARTDVIAVPTRTGTAQAGAAGTITLDTGASSVDDFYNNQIVVITGGTGAGQARIISDYVGSSRVASVNGNWATNPDSTSTFALLGFGAIPGAAAPTAAEVRIEMDANSTKLASIEADTQDLQSRIPAALVSGRMDSSVGAMATDTLTAAALAADAVTEIQSGLATAAALDTVDNFLDTEIAAIIATLGTPAGVSISADIAAIESQTDDIGVAGAGLSNVPWNAAWDAEVQSEVADALAVYDPPTKAELDSAVAPLALEATAQSILTDTAEIGAAGAGLTALASAANLAAVAGFIDTEVASILAAVDTEVAAILADTNELQSDWTNGGRLDLLIDAIKARTDVLPVPTRTGTAQAGAASTITLDTGASAVDDFYNNQIIIITGGTGVGQSRIVSDYVGSTRVATVNGNWATNPDNTSTFALIGFGAIPGASAPTAADIRAEMDSNSTKLASIEGDTQDIQSRLPAALVSGRIDASVGAMGNNTLTAAALASDAVTEIQSGLSTLDAAGVRSAIGLASANLDTQLAALAAFIDTEVAAIKAKTDNLPSDPADESSIQAAIATLQTFVDTEVATILAAVDTEVAAIKAKTDNLPSDPADESLIQAAIATLQAFVDTEVAAIKAKTDNLPASPANEATLTTIAGYLDTEIAAIKAKTDNLPASPAATGDAMALTSGERVSVANAALDLADGVETGLTLRQAQRIQIAALAGKLSGAATATVLIRDTNDTKNRVTATVDASGNRTAVTLDAS